MSEAPAAKRARKNSAGDAHIPSSVNQKALSQHDEAKSQKIRQHVQDLNRDQLADIVIKAAKAHDDVNTMVDSAIQKIRKNEQSRVINFNCYSESIWKDINVTYDRLSGPKQFDVVFDVAFEVCDGVVLNIDTIVKQCGPYTSLQTRLNGLSVLRKIAETITLSMNTVAQEVRKNFQSDTCLEGGMLKILSTMEPDEIKAIREDKSSPEALYPKLVELRELVGGYYIFEKLDEVLNILKGDNEYGEDDEYDQYDDEYEEYQEAYEKE